MCPWPVTIWGTRAAVVHDARMSEHVLAAGMKKPHITSPYIFWPMYLLIGLFGFVEPSMAMEA